MNSIADGYCIFQNSTNNNSFRVLPLSSNPNDKRIGKNLNDFCLSQEDIVYKIK